MSMRSFAGTLLLSNIFDFIPSRETEIYNLSIAVFNPNVLIVENDCNTTLGKFETVNYEAEGLTELATESTLSYNRITQLLSMGVYSVATRHTSTCISKDGVCKKCYEATFPNSAKVNPNDRANVNPEYLVNAEIVEYDPTVSTYNTVTDPTSYIISYVFYQGSLLKSGVDYTLVNGVLTVLNTLALAGNIVIRFMKLDKSAFVGWLAATYSGSLLGMKEVSHELLPLRPLFLASTLLENRLQLVSELVKTSKNIPTDYSQYADQIRDPLEKALYLLAVFSIYYNVTT